MKDNHVNSDYMHVMKGGPQKGHHEESTSCFRTVKLPETLDGAAADIELARYIIDGWRQDGIVRLKMTSKQIEMFRQADTSCRRFFNRSLTEKIRCVDERTYSGYTASGEEITNNIEDLPEIFTVMKDLPPEDERVRLRWPCHGPCPWPSEDFKFIVDSLMKSLAESGAKLMHLIAIGLGLQRPEELTGITDEGMHYIRILRYPPGEGKGVESKLRRGIGQSPSQIVAPNLV
jgi:isopenicillin N synthase-like dioxygenase